jgi:hypothetical protein
VKLGAAYLQLNPRDPNAPGIYLSPSVHVTRFHNFLGLLHPLLYFNPELYYPEYVETIEVLLQADRPAEALVFVRRVRRV